MSLAPMIRGGLPVWMWLSPAQLVAGPEPATLSFALPIWTWMSPVQLAAQPETTAMSFALPIWTWMSPVQLVAQPETTAMSFALMIAIGVVAVGLGVLLGMPGSGAHRARRGRRIGAHDQKEIQELEQRLGRMARRSQSTKRHFTPLDWLRRDPRASQRRRGGRYFRTVAPAERPSSGKASPAKGASPAKRASPANGTAPARSPVAAKNDPRKR